MPWFRLDDSFHSHPKVIAAGNEAIGLYVRCGTYAAQHLTDGFIPENIAILYGASEIRSRGDDAAAGTETLAETLVRTKLWRRTRGGWRMPDFLDYNFSREEVTNKRKVRAEAGRKGGLASGKARSKPEANRSPLVEPPARPGPSPPQTQTPTNTGDHSSGGSTSPGTRRRGTRLPDNWLPTRELVGWARQEFPHVDSRYETDKFRDYWHAKAGATATKLDWAKTWKNWIRKAAEQNHSKPSRQAETDEMFGDAMHLARKLDAQEAENDPRRNGIAHPLRQSALPAAGD